MITKSGYATKKSNVTQEKVNSYRQLLNEPAQEETSTPVVQEQVKPVNIRDLSVSNVLPKPKVNISAGEVKPLNIRDFVNEINNTPEGKRANLTVQTDSLKKQINTKEQEYARANNISDWNTKRQEQSRIQQELNSLREQLDSKNKDLVMLGGYNLLSGEQVEQFNKNAPLTQKIDKALKYDIPTTAKKVGRTAMDLAMQIPVGATNALEGMVDTGVGNVGALASTVADKVGADNLASRIRNGAENFVKFNFSGEEILEEKKNEGTGIYEPKVLGIKVRDALNTISNMVTAGVTGGTLGFIGSAAGQSIEEALLDNQSLNRAVIYGDVSGVIEGLTEKMFDVVKIAGGGKFDKFLPKSAIGKLIGGSVGEGIEEIISNGLNPFIKQLTYEKGTYDLPEFWDYVKMLGESFWNGAVIGLIMKGGQDISTPQFREQYKQDVYTAVDKSKLPNDIKETVKQAMITPAQQAINQDLENLRSTGSYQRTQTPTNTLPKFSEIMGKKIADTQIAKTSRPTLPTPKFYATEKGEVITPNNYVAKQETKVPQEPNYSPVNARQVLNYIQIPTAKTSKIHNTAKELNVDVQLANRVMDMAKLTEVPVSGFVDVNENIDGYYKDGAIYINKNSKKAQDRIFVHELTHNIEKADGWQGLRDTIFNSNVLYNELAEKGQTLEEYRQLIKDTYAENEIQLNEDDIDREVIAKFAEEHLLKDQKSIDRMVQENPTFMQRVKNFIDDLVVKFKGTAEEKELLRIQRMYDKAFAESKQVEAKQGTQYSLSVAEQKYNLYSQKADSAYDTRDEYTQQYDELYNSDEVKNAVQIAIKTKDMTEYLKYDEQLKKLREKAEYYDAEGKKYSEMAKEYASEVDTAENEQKAEMTADDRRKAAVKEFGYTPYFYDAGYLLPNGKMLNFSGEKGQHYGTRGQDHRAIGMVYDSLQGSQAMNAFMNEGNIRVVAESPGLDISKEAPLTSAQYKTIKEMVYEYQDKGRFLIDFSNADGKTIESLRYEGRFSADQVVNDIKHYLSTGEANRQSDIQKFRYSINTDNQGRELSKQQQEYFKDSKVRDEQGRLLEVYHGTDTGGFMVFNPKGASGYRFGDNIVNFFTNNQQMAETYTEDKGVVKTSKVPESETQIQQYLNNIEEEWGNTVSLEKTSNGYKLTTDDGYETLGSYKNLNELSDNYKRDIENYFGFGDTFGGLYKVYLNIKNPLIVEGNGNMWSNLYNPITEERARTTNEIIQSAIDAGEYDGVIFRNINDYGWKTTTDTEVSSTNDVYVTIKDSNQIKAVDNTNPTENEDIRYSVETREVDFPEKVGDRYLSRHAKTLAESGVTMPETVDLIEKMVKDGSLTHERITDKKALAYAEKYIEENGFKDAVDHWNHLTKSNRELSKEELALGQLIFNTANTNQDVQLVKKMIADLVVKGTQAGRSLQAMSMVKKMTPDGRLYSLERTVQKLNQDLREQFGKDFKDIEIPDDLAEKLLKSKTTKETDAAVEEIQQYIADRVPATWGDKANAWRYLAMLGNPRTHIRNVLGNAVFIPAVEIKNLIATGIEKTLPKAERTKAVVGLKDTDLLNFAESDFDTHQEAVRGENKYDITAGVQEKQRVFNNKVLETLRKKNFELLEKEDATFLKYHYKRAMASALKARGITLKELRSGTPESIKKLDQVRQYAINEAQKATYRDFNSMANWVSSQKRRLKRASGTSKAAKVGSMVAEGIIPFTKTPANILKRGIEYSPVGLVKGIYDATTQVKKGKVTASQAIDEMAAGLTGTGIVMLGALLKSLGLIVGGDEEKQKEQNFEKLKGNQNYALKIGNKTYTIDWMAPSSMPLFVGVEVVDLLQGENISDIIGSIGNITEPVFELSMLQGLNSTMNTLGSDNPIAETFSNTVESYFGQYNPTFLGQIARTIDPKRRTTYADKNSIVPSALQTFAQKQLQKIPFASKTLPTYKDQFGRESETENVVERIFSNFMSPGYLADVKDQPVENELTKLYEKTGESAILPSYASKSITVDKQKKNLTAKEYDTFAKVRGNVAYDNLEKLMTSQEYKSMDDEQKIKAIKKIYDYANSVGKSKVSDYELTKSEQQIQDYEKAGIDYYKWLILQDKADTNKNGYVTKDEMNKALNKSGLTSTQKALIKKDMNKSK